MQILKRILAPKRLFGNILQSDTPTRGALRRGCATRSPSAKTKIKGASGAIFSQTHYYANVDGFIACRLGGAVVDKKDKS